MPTGTSFNRFQNLLLEKVDAAVSNLEIRVEDPAWGIIQGFSNTKKVGRVSGAGAKSRNEAGYEARWVVQLQSGGRMTGAKFGETRATLMGPNDAHIMGYSASGLGLDPMQTPSRSNMELVSYLRRLKGQVVESEESLEAQLLATPIEQIAMGHLEDITKLVRHNTVALAWGAGDGVMATLNQAAGQAITDAAVAWVTVDAGSPFRFKAGQRYVAAATTTVKFDTPRAGSLNSPGVLRCVGVNPHTLKVGFQAEIGEGTVTLVDNDSILLEGMWDFNTAATSTTDNTPSMAPNGFENLLIDDGNFPDTSVDVGDVPELQAYIDGDYDDPDLPTPELIDKVLDLQTQGGSIEDRGPYVMLAEASIWTLYSELERRAMAMTPVTGVFTAAGGVSGPVYSYAGKSVVRLASPMCRRSTIYGLDRTSFRRYFPNDLMVQWRTQQGGVPGMPSIFRPISVGTQLSEITAADFYYWMQLAVTRPQGNFILRGIDSTQTASAA